MRSCPYYYYHNPKLTTTATTKHAVLGLLRSLHPQLYPTLPIRINAIAPSWTETGIVPASLLAALGPESYQSPDVVARSVTLLMADAQRHGELVYSECGRFRELENSENGFQEGVSRALGAEGVEVLKAFKGAVGRGEESG